MGYTVRIGNAELERIDDYGHHDYRVVVKRTGAEGAPIYPGDSGPCGEGCNERWPSYSGWATFLRNVGLYNLFMDEHGLMKQHPGCKPLTTENVEQIEAALVAYRAKHPGAVPAFLLEAEGETYTEYSARCDRDQPAENGWLLRLEWLAWWCRWAVARKPRNLQQLRRNMDRYRYWAAVPLPHNRGRLVPVIMDGRVVMLWEPS